MQIVDIIQKKRDKQELSEDEIKYFVHGYVSGDIPDYQIAALLMAIWFNGMNKKETTVITMAMVDSGDTIDLSFVPGVKVDKHSTGGVADTTTLITVPLVAAAGGYVAKMSGRGLGHTGGTLDKLESIPGFKVFLSMKQVAEVVEKCGCAIVGQTGNLVPADKLLYALRDVTCTVDSIPLIAGSIMSKKIASGCEKIVLDVKTGNGAFMKNKKSAVELARLMVGIGKLAARETRALVTDMNQPLGNFIGNSLEVKEAIEVLRGESPGDLQKVAIALAEHMVLVAGVCNSPEDAHNTVFRCLNQGYGLEKLKTMIELQAGNPRVVDDVSLLPQAPEILTLEAEKKGFINAMDTTLLGHAARVMGAGRMKKDDTIDYSAGYCLHKRLGDAVDAGEPLATFYAKNNSAIENGVALFCKGVSITEEKGARPPLIYQEIIE